MVMAHVLTRVLVAKFIASFDRATLLTLTHFSFVGFVVICDMVLNETCGIAVPYNSNIRRIATVLADNAILGVMSNGLSIPLLQPISSGILNSVIHIMLARQPNFFFTSTDRFRSVVRGVKEMEFHLL